MICDYIVFLSLSMIGMLTADSPSTLQLFEKLRMVWLWMLTKKWQNIAILFLFNYLKYLSCFKLLQNISNNSILYLAETKTSVQVKKLMLLSEKHLAYSIDSLLVAYVYSFHHYGGILWDPDHPVYVIEVASVNNSNP